MRDTNASSPEGSPLMRTAILCFVFAAAAYAEVPATYAYVQRREISPDGQTITAVVRVVRRGTYVVVAGYAIDKDKKYQFYRGGISRIKAYEEKELKGEPGDQVEIVNFVGGGEAAFRR